MQYIVIFIPAIVWGLVPLNVSKIGGSPANQIFGTALGTLIVGLAVTGIVGVHLSPLNFILSMLAGMF